MSRLLTGLLGVLLTVGLARDAIAESKSLDVFNRRILPIMNSARPSSCSECHLSSVDLKDYIRADQAETFAALVEGGMIDAQQPQKSKLLEFISRAPTKPTIVSADVRKEELAAFTAWIEEAVRDPELLKAKAGSETLGPKLPVEVVSHARNDPTLPPGMYLVKIYVDGAGRLEKDWQAQLGDRDFVGQVEVDSRWPAGYGNMTTAAFPVRTQISRQR